MLPKIISSTSLILSRIAPKFSPNDCKNKQKKRRINRALLEANCPKVLRRKRTERKDGDRLHRY
jgi:hypothetical protein